MHLTRQAERALKTTFLEAKLFQNPSINTAHLLLCILRNENDPTTKLLHKLQIDYETVKDQFKMISADESDEVMDISMSSPMSEESEDDASPKKSKPIWTSTESKSNKKSSTPVLDNFGRDLTALAIENKLDPVIGRQKKLSVYLKF